MQPQDGTTRGRLRLPAKRATYTLRALVIVVAFVVHSAFCISHSALKGGGGRGAPLFAPQPLMSCAAGGDGDAQDGWRRLADRPARGEWGTPRRGRTCRQGRSFSDGRGTAACGVGGRERSVSGQPRPGETGEAGGLRGARESPQPRPRLVPVIALGLRSGLEGPIACGRSSQCERKFPCTPA